MDQPQHWMYWNKQALKQFSEYAKGSTTTLDVLKFFYPLIWQLLKHDQPQHWMYWNQQAFQDPKWRAERINHNIGCIEILNLLCIHISKLKLINHNIGCIEIWTNIYKDFQCKNDQPQHWMYWNGVFFDAYCPLWRINHNIGCIEMFYKLNLFSKQLKINHNIGCIEIETRRDNAYIGRIKINHNIGCIEI